MIGTIEVLQASDPRPDYITIARGESPPGVLQTDGITFFMPPAQAIGVYQITGKYHSN